MKYALSIDWLSLYCQSETGEICQYVERYGYILAPHGTRQFRQLITVTLDGEDFVEVQQQPCSSILKPRTLIVKVCNRHLYSAGLWYKLNCFLEWNKLQVLNVSRCDICADFNVFHNNLQPVSLIRRFLSSELRHIGRGIGNAHFNHFAKREGKVSKSYLNYTGLSFGSNESAARAYLYNKSFELLTVKDKPWIRQLWKECGLVNTPECNVWRLEISIKSKGMNFADKVTHEKYTVSNSALQEKSFVSLIFHTFARALFSFVRNRDGITNISREPRIQLFNGEEYVNRVVLAAESGGNRTERILIKQLWQMSETYRGNDIVEDEGISKILANNLAANTGLLEWLQEKSKLWDTPRKK